MILNVFVVNDGRGSLEGGEADETLFIEIQIAGWSEQAQWATCFEGESKIRRPEFIDTTLQEILVSKSMVLKILLEAWSLLEDVLENFMQWESNAYIALDDAIVIRKFMAMCMDVLELSKAIKTKGREAESYIYEIKVVGDYLIKLLLISDSQMFKKLDSDLHLVLPITEYHALGNFRVRERKEAEESCTLKLELRPRARDSYVYVGHAIQETGINGICNNKAIRIDVGMFIRLLCCSKFIGAAACVGCCWNRAAENLYGYTVAEVCRKNPTDLLVEAKVAMCSNFVLKRNEYRHCVMEIED
ncbi:hypothetical protein Tco_0536313 [Tanacetum coccineum]